MLYSSRAFFGFCAVLFLVGCEDSQPLSTGPSPSAQPPVATLAKPGDDLKGVSSQEMEAFDDNGPRMAVLLIYPKAGEINSEFRQAIDPYLVFDADKQEAAQAAIVGLKGKYTSREVARVIVLLEDMWKCPEEVIGFKVRAGNEEVELSKGTPLTAADWEVLDLTRRAGNVAGNLEGENYPEKAVELFDSEPVPDAAPRFIAFLERVKGGYEERAKQRAAVTNPSADPACGACING